MIPRVFISCVSSEFRSLRSRVAESIRRIGWEPVLMDEWPTGDGGLMDWHRKEIDSCDALIQITGIAYGEEPPEHNPADHGIPGASQRYSYTQFEFHYAIAKGKKTWLIIPGPRCTRDTPETLLDLPKDGAGQHDPSLPDAALHQQTRREIQKAYVEQLIRNNHLRHTPEDNKDLDILILRLRNLPEEARHDFDRWHDHLDKNIGKLGERIRRISSQNWAIIGLLMVLLIMGLSSMVVNWSEDNPTINRHSLRKAMIDASSAELKREEALAEEAAKKNPQLGSQELERRRQTAVESHKKRLDDVDKNVKDIITMMESPSDPILNELNLVMNKDGIDGAMKYLDTKRLEIIDRSSGRNNRARKDLEPLLIAARFAITSGRYENAEKLFKDLVRPSNYWPQARHEYWDFLVNVKGSRSASLAPRAETDKIYKDAEFHARRLTEDEPTNVQWLSDLAITFDRMGDLERRAGHPDKAEHFYNESLKIRQKIIVDNTDPRWLRDVSISLNCLGDLERDRNKSVEATARYEEALEIRDGLVKKNPGNVEYQRELGISYNCLGNMARMREDFGRAEQLHRKARDIYQDLMKTHPADQDFQHEEGMAVSLACLGDVARDQKQWNVATASYKKSLEIRKELEKSEPANKLRAGNSFVSQFSLGKAYMGIRDIIGARTCFADCVAITKKLMDIDESNLPRRRDYGISLLFLARCLDEEGDSLAANSQWQKAGQVINELQRDGFVFAADDRPILDELEIRSSPRSIR